MTEQHECEWEIYETELVWSPVCKKVLLAEDIIRFLNEYETLESQIDAMRDFMALLYLGIREGRDEAFEALDDKTKHLINEVWFERLEDDES